MYDEPIALPKVICTRSEGSSKEGSMKLPVVANVVEQTAAAADANPLMAAHESHRIGSNEPLVELLRVSNISSYRSSQDLYAVCVRAESESEETHQAPPVAQELKDPGFSSSVSFFMDRRDGGLPEVSVDPFSDELEVLSPLFQGP